MHQITNALAICLFNAVGSGSIRKVTKKKQSQERKQILFAITWKPSSFTEAIACHKPQSLFPLCFPKTVYRRGEEAIYE